MDSKKEYKGMASELDPVAIKKLYYEYQMTNQEISDMTWGTKANVNKVLVHGIKYYTSWEIDSLTDDEQRIFRDMLISHKFEYDDVGTDRKYLIKNSSQGKICFIWYDADSVKCLFDEKVPETLKTLAIKEKMNLYNSLDYEVLEKGTIDSVLKKKCIFLNNDAKAVFNKAARKRKMNGKEYANFLGFEKPLTEKDTNRDSNIINFLEEHLVDGVVFLSSAPENQWIRAYASRCHMPIEDFISFFGYTKSKYDYNYISKNKDEKYKIKLAEYVTQMPNYVYIPTQDAIYRNLYSIAKLNNITLDEYIEKLGYIRTKKVSEIQEISDEIEEIIKKEKNEVEKELHSEEKIKRNHQIINKLKRFYGYECQLCNDAQKIIIKKEDGTNYVEVHHIKNLSLEMDEEGTLDRVNNLIVVCPNHHKMLHYHHGGYTKIKMCNGKLAFVNDSAEILPIINNKHLKEN